MPAKNYGVKHTCFKCQTKFYDMKKPDPLCPKCGTDQRESPALRPAPEPRRGRLAAVAKVVEPVEVEEAAEVPAEELDTFEDEEEAEASDEEEV
jgi:hypothetical protein